MLYFTSDTHFNHKKILSLCNRPWPDIPTMNQALIRLWNETVLNYYDDVYVLGDFAFWNRDAQPLDEIFHQLKGVKHLIVGNHDEQNRKVLQLPWASQLLLAHIKYEEHRFIACHFPLERWWHQERGVLHVHGHCHGGLSRFEAHRFDVGVDVHAYRPVAAPTLIRLAAEQPFTPTDYHIPVSE